MNNYIKLERNCHGCGGRHTGVCGVKCKYRAEFLSTGMALISGFDRSSPEYLKALEEELSQARVTKKSMEDELEKYKFDVAGGSTIKFDPDSPILRAITDRLSNIELSMKSTPGITAPTMTAPVTAAATSLAAPPPRPPPPPPLPSHGLDISHASPPLVTAVTSTFSGVPSVPLLSTHGITMTTASGPYHGVVSASYSGVPSYPPHHHVVPAHALGSPLTSALQRIVSPHSQQGKEHDPSAYVLLTKTESEAKNFDRSKMDLNDLFFGWMQVAKMIINGAGNIRSYIDHLAFAAEMFHSRKFSVKGLVDYFAYIVNRVMSGAISRFGPDPSLHFSPNVIQESPATGGWSQRSGRGRRNNRRQRQPNNNNQLEDKVEVPPDFPPEICYLYNYRTCPGNCGRNHVCRVCRGKHEAKSCNVKKF